MLLLANALFSEALLRVLHHAGFGTLGKIDRFYKRDAQSGKRKKQHFPHPLARFDA